MLDKDKFFCSVSVIRILLLERVFSRYGTTGEGKVGKPGRNASDNTIPRLTERNFLRKVQPTGKKESDHRGFMCTKHGKRKETVYRCKECDVGLCLEDCFKV
jgi:hypothetical protein